MRYKNNVMLLSEKMERRESSIAIKKSQRGINEKSVVYFPSDVGGICFHPT
ncbi:hypothetical protein [Dickeya chrysanthemi]|uniref:hypothetical protein n=1 Tax=Dickeya chrysanthemi TaxID=556 RepID=UPI001CF455AD|nr:hypothetical protein [Dickeya chrysanthemi]MCA7009431.1 hypothetical protein [Dickeya chrysanthemi]